MTSPDTLRIFAKVGFPALQFNAVKKQFVATCKLPITVIDESEDRSFAALDREVRAVTGIADSFSLTWPALVAAVADGHVEARR